VTVSCQTFVWRLCGVSLFGYSVGVVHLTAGDTPLNETLGTYDLDAIYRWHPPDIYSTDSTDR
jgi:hypothetical protein